MIDLRERRPARPPEFEDVLPKNADIKTRRAHERLCTARQDITKIIAGGNNPTHDDFNDSPHWKRYKPILAEAQHDGKCAYCESCIRAGYPGDVEHYRPKTAVTQVTEDSNEKYRLGKATKPGYWWLAYSFENFLFSCFECNNKKGTRFPVRGRSKRLKSGSEAKEQPLLLNPYDTDPSKHLHFDEFGGVRGRTAIGRMTVYVCGLDRRYLELERERTAKGVSRDIEDYKDALVENNDLADRQTLRRLLDACRPEEPYAGLARALVEEHLEYTYADLLAAEKAGFV